MSLVFEAIVTDPSIRIPDSKDQGAPKTRRPSSRRRHSANNHACFRVGGCWVVIFLFILLALYGTILVLVNPVMKTLKVAPKDLPANFIIYEVESADIDVSSAGNQAPLFNVVDSLPDWMAGYALNLFSDQWRSSFNDWLATQTEEEGRADESDSSSPQLNTVNLSWDKLDKSKEELSVFYKNQFWSQGIEFEEHISDYEINFNFWSEDFFGKMSVKDLDGEGDEADKDSMMTMIINYFNQNK